MARQNLGELRRRLLEVLGVGKKQVITAKELDEILDIPPTSTSPTLRIKVVDYLVKEDHIPIGSCETGFYIIETREELIENLRELDKRIDGIREKQAGLKVGFPLYRHRGGRGRA